MPLVTITVQKPKTTQFKDTVLNAVHEALVASGIPETDRFQRVLELNAEDFRRRQIPSHVDMAQVRHPTHKHHVDSSSTH